VLARLVSAEQPHRRRLGRTKGQGSVLASFSAAATWIACRLVSQSRAVQRDRREG